MNTTVVRQQLTHARSKAAALCVWICLLSACSISDAGLQPSASSTNQDAGPANPPDPDGPVVVDPSKAPPGTPCVQNAECGKGVCAGGVCCDGPCGGGCFSCTLPGAVGKCSPIPAGTMPRIENTCLKEGPNTCGFDSSCDGAGGCRRHVAGTSCGQGSCDEGSETPAPKCDGKGTCTSTAPKACAPYMCGIRACAAECRSDDDCSNKTQCLGNNKCEIVDAPVVKSTVSVPGVDGDIDDIWTSSGATWQDISKVTAGSVGSTEDLKARWKTLWTAEAVYLLVDVMDSSLINDSAEPWKDDSVEVYFDANNSRGQTYDKVDDLQYFFSWNDPNLTETKLQRTQGVTFAIRTAQNGKSYVLEARFPWTTLGLNKPVVGSRIGFQLAIDDDDLMGGDRDAQVTWYGELADSASRPASFGELVLGGP